jgi:hypothetical protein
MVRDTSLPTETGQVIERAIARDLSEDSRVAHDVRVRVDAPLIIRAEQRISL